MPDENANADDLVPLDELDDEFSLDKLSKAYADVVRQRSAEGESAQTDGDVSSAVESSAAVLKKTATVPTKKAQGPSTAAASEAEDNRGCRIEPETIIESIVFVGAPRGESLTLSGVAGVMRDVSAADVRESVKELNEKYQEDKSAWRIVIQGDGEDAEIKMVLVEQLREFQNHYFGRNKEVQLSQGTIDVLAVVAYHQPVSKDEVETTRGKPSGSVLAQLVRRNLVEIETTDDKPARRLYRTSKRFLELFHLSDVQDLPQSHDVSEFEEYID